jgi:tubulin monoglycylase TTLL3/8
MFGYDFMVDERLNVWLIEVNSSPAMDYSTVFIFITKMYKHITEKLVKEVSEDLVKVIVDYGMAGKTARKEVDTGKFL